MSRRYQNRLVANAMARLSAPISGVPATPEQATALQRLVTDLISANAAAIVGIGSRNRIAVLAHEPEAKWVEVLRSYGWRRGSPMAMAKEFGRRLATADHITKRWIERETIWKPGAIVLRVFLVIGYGSLLLNLRFADDGYTIEIEPGSLGCEGWSN